MKHALLFIFSILNCDIAYSLDKPTEGDIQKLFPQYKNLHISNDRPEDYRAHPCKQGNCEVAAAEGVEDVIAKHGKAELTKDLDGDGKVDYVFVGKWNGKQSMCEGGDQALMLGILQKTDHGWKALHDRHTGENCVLSAFLSETKKGFEVYILEARFTCDDAKLEKYEIAWDKSKKSLFVPVKGSELHPFKRSWNCGE